MIVLSAFGLSKSFGAEKIFDQVSFKVDAKDKIGLVGVNGAGKTTLFRLLIGQEPSDSGEISLEHGAKIAYMQQHSDYTSQQSAIEEVLQVFSSLSQMESQLEQIAAQLQNSADEGLIRKQHELTERFTQQGGLTYRSRARSALLGLGFSESELQLPMCSLSGGQRTRVILARILLSDSDLLLLDEPTNHLDVQATQWLEDFLVTYRGAVMIISHDRYFLDRICNRIFELQNGLLDTYPGNYTEYRKQKALKRLTAQREYDSKQKQIHRIEGIIEQQKRFNQAHNYVTIKSKQKQIDRIAATLEAPPPDPESIDFHFSCCGPCANEVLNADKICKRFGEQTLFSDVTIQVRRGERVFLNGPNGCGKTTLLRILVGQTAPDEGSVSIGPRVQIGYYDQTQSDLNLDKTVFDEIADAYPKLGNTAVRNALGVFLFHGDDVFKRVRDLSGGERARVALVKLMLSQTNFLILDEPTNHLDIESKEVLENALLGYDGTLLVVSHDRYFINKLATKIYDLGQTGAVCYAGDYNYYLSKREEISVRKVEETPSKDKGASDYANRKAQQSLKRKQKARLLRLEEEIHQTEQQLTALQAELENPEIAGDYVILTEKTQQLNELSVQLDALYTEWTELSDVQENACNGV